MLGIWPVPMLPGHFVPVKVETPQDIILETEKEPGVLVFLCY